MATVDMVTDTYHRIEEKQYVVLFRFQVKEDAELFNELPEKYRGRFELVAGAMEDPVHKGYYRLAQIKVKKRQVWGI